MLKFLLMLSLFTSQLSFKYSQFCKSSKWKSFTFASIFFTYITRTSFRRSIFCAFCYSDFSIKKHIFVMADTFFIIFRQILYGLYISLLNMQIGHAKKQVQQNSSIPEESRYTCRIFKLSHPSRSFLPDQIRSVVSSVAITAWKYYSKCLRVSQGNNCLHHTKNCFVFIAFQS